MSARPFHRNLTVYQGADFEDAFTWNAGEPLAPVDLSGVQSARAQFRASVGAPTVLCELTTDNGRIVLGGAAGTITLKLDAATTTAFAWRTGVWDMELVYTDGRVRRFMQGAVTVDPNVTRA